MDSSMKKKSINFFLVQKQEKQGRDTETMREEKERKKHFQVRSLTLFGDLFCPFQPPNQTHHTRSLLSEIIII